MPFGLTNALATFQTMINYVLREHLDVTVIAYLNDILIFSKTLPEHIQVVREVLQRLQRHGLYAKESKCVFHAQSIEFLGMIVSANGLQMCTDKVQAIEAWPVPRTVKEI